MDYFYFIVDEVASSNKADLPTGTRVFRIPELIAFPPRPHPSLPNLPIVLDTGEGPYESIQQLKDNSELFQEVLKTNPKRAAKIFDDRFLIPIEIGGYAMYRGTINDDFHQHIYPLLLHTINGTLTKSDVFGVHYYNPDRIEIRQIVGFDEENEVWQAQISVYNANTNKWINKREPATFFPRLWTLTRLLAECEYAYTRRVRVSKNKYKGVTESGIIVVFIHDEAGKFKTIYPICEELQ